MNATPYIPRSAARLLVSSLAMLTTGANSGSGPQQPPDLRTDAATSGGQLKEVTPGNLLVFVGRRIAVREVLPREDEIWFDRKFVARYAVLSVVYGALTAPEIEFTAFDHKVPPKALPGFARNEVALLYVSKDGGQLVHEKYQYDNVSRTRDGRWGLCGDPQPPSGPSRLRPHPIELKGTVAVCKEGFYADELFEIRKRGVLRARGLFE